MERFPDPDQTSCQGQTRATGIDYHGQCRRAAELHSDFFDFVPSGDGGLLFFIGDVAGYGDSSKMIGGGIGNLLRSRREGGLKSLVGEINRSLCDLSPNGLYVTLFCGLADPVRRQLSYVSAGHEPVILVNRISGRLRRLESTGTVLGLTPRSAYRQHTVSLETGDTLAAFTDGVTEALGINGEEFREDGIVRVLRENPDAGAAGLCGAVLAAIEQFGGGALAADDQTIAVLRFQPEATLKSLRDEAEELAMAAA